MAHSPAPISRQPDLRLLHCGWRTNPGTGHLADPFAANPIRRSTGLVTVCGVIVFGPLLIGGEAVALVMLSVGWLAVSGLMLGLPILIWSLVEELWRVVARRLYPTVGDLSISPRIVHILARHGYTTIRATDRAPDAALLLLANMDPRALREVRRAINLWKYQRWQERGFPATGFE